MEAQKAELRAIVKDGQEAAVTADENLLVALFRKVPKQRRAAVLAFVRSASGTTTPSANKRNCKHGKTKLRGAANTELRAARLRATYELLVRDSDLANPELSNDERMSRAIHLRNTYDRLHKLVPSFHDDAEQLRLARKMLNNRAHQRRKAAELT